MCPMEGAEDLLRSMALMSICMAEPIPAISGLDGDIMPEAPVADPEGVEAVAPVRVPAPVQVAAALAVAKRIPTQQIRKLLNE